MTDWIPVSKNEPQEMEEVLFLLEGGKKVVSKITRYDKWGVPIMAVVIGNKKPTHFVRIPPVPKEVGK